MNFRINHRLRFALSVISIGCVVLLLSCNNGAKTDDGNEAAGTPAKIIPLSTDSAARVDDFSFIDGCVEINKGKMEESKAFAHCKCVMAEIKLKYGNTDSTTIARLQQDTAEIARILKTCK